MKVALYGAFGDSITYGTGLPSQSLAYPWLISSQRSLYLMDAAIAGDQACDVFPRQIIPHTAGYAGSFYARYSLLIGTNDVNRKGVGAYEGVFNNCQAALLAWLGTLPTDRIMPGDAQLRVSGGCRNQADPAWLGGIYCAAGPGTIKASDFLTSGRPIYVWYEFGDDSASSAIFSVSIDNDPAQTVTTLSGTPVATQNGTRQTVGLLRIPVAAGSHQVQIETAAGSVSILAIGSNRSFKPIPLAVGDVPNQLITSPQSAETIQIVYSRDIQQNIATAMADGIDARFVADRLVMLGTPEEMKDSLHPNALGHQHLAQAFLAVMP